jgi:phosphatidylethanolamine-binding protein (PEBP) family uncharacterized protein
MLSNLRFLLLPIGGALVVKEKIDLLWQPQSEKHKFDMKRIIKINRIILVCMMISIVSASCQKDKEQSIAPTADSLFTLTSDAVSNGLLLDAYKCEPKVNGIENSIPLSWSNAPANANSFAITMVHYPNPNDSIHLNSYLILWGIDKSVIVIPYAQADKGPWFMGSNKDTTAISYTSPCSPSSGAHKYTITIYALSATPQSLPANSSITVTYGVLMNALSTVTIIDTAILVFNNITP